MSGAGAQVWRPLKAALGGLVDVPADLEVCDLTQDSRSVTRGAAFMACRGRTHHGLEFAGAAAAAGASVILWEPAPGVTAPSLDPSILVRAVPNLHAQLGYIADRFFDAPSASLTVAGITGTNGKTTCAWLLAQALGRSGRRAAYLGTLGAGGLGALQALGLTTPDAVTLHRLLARWREAGFEAVAMEVSSHALDQDRCAGVRFHTAVFTNLTRDHLDYHADMAAYAAAKARLFDWPTLTARVINVDDPFGLELAQQSMRGARTAQLMRTSRHSLSAAAGATDWVCAAAVRAHSQGLEIEVQSSRGAARLSSPLIGIFNVDNLLSVLGVLLSWDVPLADACVALSHCEAPPGRMQSEGGGAAPLVLIDYAHTPDALAKALLAAREHCRGRLRVVFGCGGERDVGKRSAMGRLAAELADELFVTDDNPRREDPELITAAIMQGVVAAGGAARARLIHDRAEAIHRALEASRAQDVVLVAGKGHEDYQIVGVERRAFDDAGVARAALRNWAVAGSSA
ncbi:MAG: UDP-N-acetylmuramoyl-L-alanyl-D-glutamate--2,6-diaminopimelate ligase [Steroidobacteraceae bacterium]|jgi:UDP-N-acetylmuramoyl-L-alanyl-D-glutamate--2,6-diaminopimelate ligase